MISVKLKKAIDTVKANGRTISNVYSADIINHVASFYYNAEAVIMVSNDHGVARLYYYANKLMHIKEVLLQLPDSEYILEYMTKEPEDNSDILKCMGFKRLARMMRMSNRDYATVADNKAVTRYYDETIGIYPQTELASEINQVLWNVFDTRVSHLLTEEELKCSIENNEVLIHQNNAGKIDAVLQTVYNPRKFYINQIYNGAVKNVIHAMLQRRLKEYTAVGGKYVYAWVEYDNIASVKFHQKYGLQHDGMWNMVYVLKKG